MAKVTQCWTYKELQQKYNVDSRRFRRLISPILDELEEIGYVNNQRTFSPKQVQIIFEFLDVS